MCNWDFNNCRCGEVELRKELYDLKAQTAALVEAATEWAEELERVMLAPIDENSGIGPVKLKLYRATKALTNGGGGE